jgi:hypothetical protein
MSKQLAVISATAAVAEQPAFRIVAVPAAIDISADYGVVALVAAELLAERVAAFLLGPTGQAILVGKSFSPTKPAMATGSVKGTMCPMTGAETSQAIFIQTVRDSV